MSRPLTARRLLASGRVQGVNFRGWVRERAQARHVAGWAENRPDGTVEVFLQGHPDAVAAVERAVGEGPPHGRVDRVEAEDAQPRDGLAGFERR